jgi:hypothetical protein
MSVRWSVAHRTPGRIRFKVLCEKGDRTIFQKVYRIGESIDAVFGIESNPLTGSVIVNYDKADPSCEARIEKTFREDIIAASTIPAEQSEAGTQKEADTAEQMAYEEATLISSVLPEASEIEVATQVIEADAEKLAKRSTLIARLVNAFKSINAKIRRATHNVLDLPLLLILPLSLYSLFFKKKDTFFWAIFGIFSVHALINLWPQEPGVAG